VSIVLAVLVAACAGVVAVLKRAATWLSAPEAGELDDFDLWERQFVHRVNPKAWEARP
jgi:hypothetical protein